MDLGQLDEALSAANRARAILFESEGPDTVESANVEGTIGAILIEQQQLDRAMTVLDRDRTILEKHASFQKLGTLLVYEGVVAREQGDLERARQHFDRALELLRTYQGVNSVYVALCDIERGRLEFRRSRLRAAEQDYGEALAILSKRGIVMGRSRAQALLGLGEVALAEHHVGDAITLLEDAQRSAAPPDGNPYDRAAIQFTLAWALIERDSSRARALAEQAFSIYAADRNFVRKKNEIERWLRAH
jgi:tetratricopeptide (TPR) repeat protein